MNWILLQNSFVVAGGTTVAALVAGLFGALFLQCVGQGLRRVCVSLAVLALALPPFLVTNSWLDLLGQAGAWRPWFPLNPYSIVGTIWILTLLLWPITLLLAWAGLQKLQLSHLEAEPALRGARLIQWLVWPLIRPSLAIAAVLTFVLALNNFAVPAILQTKVYPAELWVSFNTTFDYGLALKQAWPLLLLPFVLIATFAHRPMAWPRVGAGVNHRCFRQRLGPGWIAAATLVTAGAIFFSALVPLGQLAFAPRTWLELPGAFAAGRPAVTNSLLFAALGACGCLLVGGLAARFTWGLGLWVLFLMPGVVLGMGLIFAFNRDGLAAFYQSAGIVLLALVLRYAALSWTAVRAALRALDPRELDFARLCGASPWQRLRYVIGPQVLPEVTAAGYVTYLLCLWDVETLILIIPPGNETLALRIFNLLHYGHNAQVNALCVLLLGLALLPLLGTWLVARRGVGKRAGLGLLSLALIATGCERNVSNERPVQSEFFSKVQIIGGRGTALGQFNKPRSLTLDAADNLYVVDMTGRVQKFSSNGVYLASWQMPQIEKGKPKGMCLDAAGNIVVVEPHYSRVNHFTTDGKLVAQWGVSGTNDGQLTLPRSAAIDSHGNLLICEYTLVDRVQRFSALGREWKQTFGHSGLGPGEFNRPEGVALDRQDQIYVADSCNHRIQVFSADGKYLRSYGRAGTGPGDLSYPYDIKVDAAGFQYVAEFGNSRVQIFDQHGLSVETIGKAGAAPGEFSNPWSLALDSAGNLYVADSQNHRVQKFIRKPGRVNLTAHVGPPGAVERR